jgi:class 3 adenylate cyclase/tetratricopeptide (TPR) repeat protein
VTVCHQCFADSPWDFSVCPSCGAPAAGVIAESVQERKVVSVLFCDLVGFTSLSENADPEEVREILTPYHRLLRSEIERLGGTVEKFIGDAVMAVFGAPVVREDDARRAVLAGLRILDRLQDLNQSLAPTVLAVRIGIATGEVLVTVTARAIDGEGIVAGDVVNTAARLQTAAEVGTVLVNEATWRATSHQVDYLDRPDVTVKGKAAPVSVWRPVAVHEDDAEAVDVGPRLIGRGPEIDELLGTLARAETGDTAHVAITGVAGIGKSALLRTSAVRDPSSATWLRGRCMPRGEGHSFSLVSQWITAELRPASPDPSAVAAALELRVAELFANTDDSDRNWLVSRIGVLLGLPGTPQVPRDELFTAWSRYLEALAAAGPVVLVAEDAQHAEAGLIDFLTALAERARRAPLEIVMAARSESAVTGEATAIHAAATTIVVPPLTPDQVAEWLPSLCGTSRVDDALTTLIVDRSGGNPLFIVEFVRMLDDHGWLTRDGESAAIAADARRDELPQTVQAVIAARLDELPDQLKRLLMDAAVLGETFTEAALIAVTDAAIDPAALALSLEDLSARQFIGARQDTVGAVSFGFVHSPVQEVAYHQMPRAGRLARHERMATWFGTQASAESTDAGQRAAHHAEQALALAEQGRDTSAVPRLRDLAARSRILAGDESGYRDVLAAHDHYERALALLHPDGAEPNTRAVADLLVKLGLTELMTGDFDDAWAHLSHAFDAVEALRPANGESRPTEDAVVQSEAMIGLLRIEAHRGRERAELSFVLAGRLLTVLAELDTDWARFSGARYEGHRARYQGRPAEVEAAYSRAVDIAQVLGDADLIVAALGSRIISRLEGSNPAGALADIASALEISQATGDRTGPFLYNNAASAIAELRSPAEALDAAEHGLRIARQRGYQSGAAWIEGTTMPDILIELGRWLDAFGAISGAREWATTHRMTNVRDFGRVLEIAITWFRQGDEPAFDLLSQHVDQILHDDADPCAVGLAIILAACTASNAQDRAIADDRLRGFLTEPLFPELLRWLPDLVRHLATIREPDLIRWQIDAAPEGNLRTANSLLTARGVLAELEGDADTAVEHYLQAAQAWRAFDQPYEHALALLGAARCRPSSDPQVGKWLNEARTIAVTLGAAPLVATIDGWASSG